MRTHQFSIGVAALLVAAAVASAQQSQPAPPSQPAPAAAQPQQPSLADAARKSREQKKADTKPSKVFTNDNIPAVGGVNVVGDASVPSQNPQPGENASPATSGTNEKAWRGRFAKAHDKLARDQADLDVMQRELGKISVQYYSDPTKQLMQSVTNEDINKQRGKIDAKKAEVAADQQAISDLEDALRKAGGDPGWAR